MPKREKRKLPSAKREKGKRHPATFEIQFHSASRPRVRMYEGFLGRAPANLPYINIYIYIYIYICDMHITFKYIYIYIHIVLTLCIRCLPDLSARHSTQSRNTRNRRFRWQPQIRPLVVSLSVLFQEEARCQCFHLLAAWVPCLFLLLSLQVHLNWLFQPPR